MNKTTEKVGMTPSHPGAFIRDEVLSPLELSITKAAEILGVRTATLSDLVNAKAGLSAEMALRLEKAFGASMELLLRMQTARDVATARERADAIDVQRYEPA